MEWIKIKDQCPPVGEYVLLYDKALNLVYEGKLREGEFFYSDRLGFSEDLEDEWEITHWMPLPFPPKECK